MLVTSGPTHEPIDPVRYLANRSSGRQGHAIAEAAAAAGARVTLVSGPVTIPDPAGVTVVHVETARQMLEAVEAALPADVAVMAAAVADWRAAAESGGKIKKDGSGRPPALALTENPDILATIGRHHTLRPALVVGFAAETDDLLANARKKLAAKGADWILANDVSPASGIMGGDGERGASRQPRRRRGLAAHGQARRRPASGGAHRGGHWREKGKNDRMTGRRPDQTACPWRRSAAAGGAARPAAAGFDLCGGRRCAADDRARRAGAGADRFRHRAAARPSKARSGRAPAWRSSTASPCSMRPAPSMPTIAAR